MDAKMRAYLEAIGYSVIETDGWRVARLNHEAPGIENNWFRSVEGAWDFCLAHSRSPEGMVATHSAKEAWLLRGARLLEAFEKDGKFTFRLHDHDLVREFRVNDCDSPQAAVEALCRKVLEAQ